MKRTIAAVALVVGLAFAVVPSADAKPRTASPKLVSTADFTISCRTMDRTVVAEPVDVVFRYRGRLVWQRPDGLQFRVVRVSQNFFGCAPVDQVTVPAWWSDN